MDKRAVHMAFTLKLKLQKSGNFVKLGRVQAEGIMHELNQLNLENDRLKKALDAADRECAALKEENERLHKENFWLSKAGQRD